MPPIPNDLHLSQGALQDYVDCPRRFELRYLLHLAWPAVPAEPAAEHEEHVRQGESFHRLVHQHILGMPMELLEASPGSPGDERLRGWWRSYLEHRPADLPGEKYPELTLSTPLAGGRLVAKFDLVAMVPGGRAAIVDWKTSARRPTQQWLMDRLQTRVYRFVLVQAGAHLNAGPALGSAGGAGSAPAPENVEMVYWFPEHPEHPERLAYDRRQFLADADYLHKLIAEIRVTPAGAFHCTSVLERCGYCTYRSLCDRGSRASQWRDNQDVLEPQDGDPAGSFDFEQIAEIGF